jgi:hypothetical protein
MQQHLRNKAESLPWYRDLCAQLARLVSLRERISEISQTADAGLTGEELRVIAEKARNLEDLLPLRLAVMHIDEAQLAGTDPALMRQLRKSCRLCDAKSQCTWDFVGDATNPRWEQYCPNAQALRTVRSHRSGRGELN